jgi:hypothetical protein
MFGSGSQANFISYSNNQIYYLQLVANMIEIYAVSTLILPVIRNRQEMCVRNLAQTDTIF